MLSIRRLSSFKHRLHNVFCVPTCLIVWLFIGALSEPAYAADLKVVPYSRKDTQFTRDELREIFFGRQTRWRDGSPLRAFVLPDQHPLHIRFSKEVLGVYPYQLRSAWDRMIYSGTGTPPALVESLEQMKTLIKETPGAIGYIEK